MELLYIDVNIEFVVMIIFPPDGMEWRWNVFVGTAGNVGYPRCNLIRSQYVDKILAKPQKKTKEKQIKKKQWIN